MEYYWSTGVPTFGETEYWSIDFGKIGVLLEYWSTNSWKFGVLEYRYSGVRSTDPPYSVPWATGNGAEGGEEGEQARE